MSIGCGMLCVAMNAVRWVAAIFADAGRLLWRHRVCWALLLVFAVTAGIGMSRWDLSLHEVMAEHNKRHPDLLAIARGFREWGAFVDVVVIAISLAVLGAIARRRWLLMAALACFLGGAASGIAVNFVRPTAGRPRPNRRLSHNLEDRFYGPSLDSGMHSFPSGHSASSSGAGVALTAAAPWLGFPALVSAGCVILASLYNENHHLSDVWAGLWIGIVFGWPIGRVCRKRMRSREHGNS